MIFTPYFYYFYSHLLYLCKYSNNVIVASKLILQIKICFVDKITYAIYITMYI